MPVTDGSTIVRAPAGARSHRKSGLRPSRAMRDAVRDARRSPARSLEPAVAEDMRARLGHDFSKVRVHHSVPAADVLNARAFTSGQDVFFAPGAFETTTPTGRELLAHELVHTVQHGDAGLDPDWTLDRSDSVVEQSADRASAQAGSGPASTPVALTPSSAAGATISRRVASPAREQSIAATAIEPGDRERTLEVRADEIVQQLQSDPYDYSGRIRRQFARMADAMRSEVLGRVRERLTVAQWAVLSQVLETPVGPETTTDTVSAPEIEPTPPAGQEAPLEPPVLEVKSESVVPTAAEPAAREPEADRAAASGEATTPSTELALGPEGAPKKPTVDTENAERAIAERGEAAPAGPAPTAGAGTGAAPDVAAESAAGGGPSVPDAATPLIEDAVPGSEAAPETSAAPPAEGPAIGDSEASAVAPETEAASRTVEGEPASESASEAAGADPPEIAALPEPSTEEQQPVPEANVPDPGPESPPSLAAVSAPPPPGALTEQPDDRPAPDIVVDQGGAGGAVEGESDTGVSPAEASSDTTGESGGTAALEQREAATPSSSTVDRGESSGAPTSTTSAEVPAATDAGPEAAAPEPAAEDNVGKGVAETPPEPAEAGLAPTAAGGESALLAPGAGSGTCSEDAGPAPAGEGQGDGGGAGGCGGGGGGTAEETPAPAPADVAAADPAEAMGAVATLPVPQVQSSLAGVSQASSAAVARQKSDLAANPPSMERPSGVPAQRDPSQPVAPPALPPARDPAGVDRAAAGAPVPTPLPVPLPPPPASPTHNLAGPQLPGDAPLTERDTAKAQAAVRNLPTTDPALNVTAGEPPTLKLAGDADPDQIKDQRAKLDQSTSQAHTQGQIDVTAPMGENEIYPTVPKENLTADVGGADGGGGGGEGLGVAGTLKACAAGGGKALEAAQAKAAGTPEDEAVGIIAEEKKGEEVRAAAAQARTDMAGKQQENAEKIADEKSKSQEAIDALIDENASQQKDERTSAREESIRLRGDWDQQQSKLIADGNTNAAKTIGESADKIDRERTGADAKAAEHITVGNREAADARQDAERKAGAEQKKAEKESDGFFGWLSSKVTAFFNKIKEAIKTVFEAARQLVRAAIEKAKKLAVAAIEAARTVVVGLIRAAGDALIAIGDTVLAGFPDLRDRFRKGVKDRVKKAEDAVNKLADDLKAGVQKLLDMLGAAINAYLGLLECAYLAAVDVVSSVVTSAIQFAKGVVQALAVFAQLIKDISPNPLQWLKYLGKSVVDGLKNCFWGAFKSSVKSWFNSKLEEVLGLGLAIWKLLFKGCIKMAEIGKMAWEGLKAAIPIILVQLLIEKLVSMIVPAAGALLTIIEGLRAAWGTVGRIITAFALFFAFLKAVKTGNAAAQFAAALAAAGIVVIDFIANWLLLRLRKPAGAIGGRLKAMAQKIGRALKGVTKALKRGGRAAAGAMRRGMRAVGRGMKRAAARIGRSKVGRAMARAGRGMQKLYMRGRAAFQRGKAKVKAWLEKRKRERERRRRRRQAEAKSKTIAALKKLLARGVSHRRLKLQVFYLKQRYRWRRLKAMAKPRAGTLQVIGGFSPDDTLVDGVIVMEEIKTSDSVKVSKSATQRGLAYEQAIHQQYINKLGAELFGKEGFEVTELIGPKSKARGRQSTLKKVFLEYQKKFLKGVGALGSKRRPEYRADVFEKDPTGKKSERPTEMHVMEVTTLLDFMDKSTRGGAHKRPQVFDTLAIMAAREPQARLIYTVISPDQPTPETRKFVKDIVVGMNLVGRLRVVWRIVKRVLV